MKWNTAKEFVLKGTNYNISNRFKSIAEMKIYFNQIFNQ